MQTLIGRYCKDVKIFTDNIEEEALSTIYGIANHPVFENTPIRIMPDTHSGKGIVIGFTAPLGEYVNPSHVGCDIGCQMTSLFYEGLVKEEDYPDLEHKVRNAIPTGFEINKKKVFNDKDFFKFMNQQMRIARSQWPEMVESINITEKYVTEMLKRIGMDEGVFYKSPGSLGSGNHFLELGEHEGHSVWTIHCGSRNFGQKVFKYWDKISKKPAISREDRREGIEEIKRKCKDKTKLASLIKEYTESQNASKPIGYLQGENMRGYLTDVFFCQAYASWNHKCIGDAISNIMMKKGYGKVIDTINTIHNYISPRDHIIRTGAIASYEGERLIIPFNMRDGLAICEGKSNPDWNYSAPHGAGRIMSRSKAKENVNLEEFRESMKGIYSTSIGTGTIDESPMVYKPMEEIIENIEPTVEILYLIKPCINIKAMETVDE